MAKHILSAEVPETLNECVLLITDTSIIDPIIPLDCPLWNITVPGFKTSVEFDEATLAAMPGAAFGGTLQFNTCDLELQTVACGTKFNALPDGIYVIKLSTSPHDVIFVTYNHLRTTKLLNNYQKILCELDLAACDPTEDIVSKLNQLRMIKMYIEAAKAKVEICHEPKKGMELYTYAKKLLTKFDCKSCQ